MFCLTAAFDNAKKKQKISHINQDYITKSITILMEVGRTPTFLASQTEFLVCLNCRLQPVANGCNK